jgi:peptidoglycan/LPS O-acetylase OafA/YrhL
MAGALETGGRVEQNLGARAARTSSIDVLRGWAVLSVVLLHLNIRVPFDGSALGRWLPKPLYKSIFWSGYQAVIVFFVVSGFLITGLSLERWGSLPRVDVPHFYRLRFARIAPMLALFVAVQAALQSASVSGFSDPHPAASLATTLFAVATFRVNWLEAKVGYLPGAWDVLWSLCIEELFYLGFPVIVRALRSRVALTALLLAFVAVGPFARVCTQSNELWRDHSYLSCMGEIALGCLAAWYLARHRPSARVALALLIGGVALMAFVLFFRRAVNALGLYDWGLDVTVLSCGTAAVLVACRARSHWSRITDHAAFAPLRWLGQRSYEVYLSHLFVVIPAAALWKERGWPPGIPFFYLGAVVGSGLLGALLASAYSKPLSSWLRRWRAT